MTIKSDWDWEPGSREISDVGQWQNQFNWVEEPYVSQDGEKLAAIVNVAEGEFNVCVNGEPWETVFDKIWNLRFAPDGRLTALVSEMGEWTVAVDGTAWENKFGYVWNLAFSPDGKNIAVAIQQDMAYCMAVNDVAWEQTFSNMTNPTLSPDGTTTAAAVQVADFGEGEIHKFQEGAFTVALEGKTWDTQFVNVWKMAISSDDQQVAAEVRLNPYDYTIAVNGKPWEQTFDCVWEPVFHPSGAVRRQVVPGAERSDDMGSEIRPALAPDVQSERQPAGCHRRSQIRQMDRRG